MKAQSTYQKMKELPQIIAQFNTQEYLVLMDENTEKHCLPVLLKEVPDLNNALFFVLPAGEKNKILAQCEAVWHFMSEQLLSRKCLIINLGGGVLCDMGGLIAGLYKRGIPFINIPTTLLAIVDASIGGKVAVDLMPYKNQIGLFNEADAQVLHMPFIETLPQVELLSGYAEMLKHALISDEKHWIVLVDNGFQNLSEDIILRSIQIKTEIVQRDPKEKGERKLLNFGHTVGHALESYYLNSETPLKHGHAVAIGMLIEAHISVQKNHLDATLYYEITKYISTHYETPKNIKDNAQLIFQIMLQDKKNERNEVRSVLLTGIGSAIYDQSVSLEDLKLALAESFT